LQWFDEPVTWSTLAAAIAHAEQDERYPIRHVFDVRRGRKLLLCKKEGSSCGHWKGLRFKRVSTTSKKALEKRLKV
jgi:hypothetical protein